MSEQSFEFHQILPPGADDTPYRKLTDDFVDTVDFDGGELLKVDPEALSLLAAEAFRDINHLLRPGHLAQLKTILDDPEASDNDRFVAYDMLKNANIAAGGVTVTYCPKAARGGSSTCVVMPGSATQTSESLVTALTSLPHGLVSEWIPATH